MSDAVRIEERLHDLFVGWRRRWDHAISDLSGRDHSADRESPREMERQAAERLFADHRRTNTAARPADLSSAREMERQVVERLYGSRTNVVVQAEPEGTDEDA